MNDTLLKQIGLLEKPQIKELIKRLIFSLPEDELIDILKEFEQLTKSE